MDEFVVAREFLSRMLHIKYADAGVTLCGITALGLLVRKFLVITQVSGKKGCEECRDEYIRIESEK